ncbi:unnamed protein product, partial [Prorocentrum cordatum]
MAPAAPGPLPREAYTRTAELHGVEISGEFAQQAARMPPLVRRLLVDGAAPSGVSAEALLDELRLSEDALRSARAGLCCTAGEALLRRPGALCAEACATLRGLVDAERQTKCDTVDGAPDHQLNLSKQQLEAHVGAAALAGLWGLAEEFGGPGRTDGMEVGLFVRRYTADSRPWNPFHVDSAELTVNVALVGDDQFTGGALLACYDGAVREVPRAEGEATVHASTLLHGVGMLTSGVRYSLILFFGRPEEPEALGPAERAAEAGALGRLVADGALMARARGVLGDARLPGRGAPGESGLGHEFRGPAEQVAPSLS